MNFNQRGSGPTQNHVLHLQLLISGDSQNFFCLFLFNRNEAYFDIKRWFIFYSVSSVLLGSVEQ